MKYLFIGGPWDQQWHHIPDGRHPWRVPEMPDLSRSSYVDDAEGLGFWEPRIHLYAPRRAMVPGWLIPLTFFVHESIRLGQPIPRGTVLPGWVEGRGPDASFVRSTFGIRWTHEDSAQAAKDAARRFNAYRRWTR